MHVGQLGIVAPCSQSLDSMSGTADPNARFCASCRERVVDLSKLTRRQAEAVLRRGECVSAAYDDEGEVVFRAERRGLPMFPQALRAAAVAAPLWLMGCRESVPESASAEPSALMTPDRPVHAVQPTVALADDEPAACVLAAPAPHPVAPAAPGVVAQPKPRAPHPVSAPHPRPFPRLAGKPAFHSKAMR